MPAGTINAPHPPDAASEVAELQRKLDLARAENFTFKRLLTERERRIEEMCQSTSWRVTALMRDFGDWLRTKRWTGLRPVAIWVLESCLVALILFLLWHPALSVATL